MSVNIFFVFIGLFCQVISKGGYLPPYIKPCQIGEEFEKCVAEQIEVSLPLFTKGVPELEVPSIDPVKLDDIKIDGNGLKLALTEAAMHGLSESKIKELKVDIENEKFTLAFKSNLTLTSKYIVDGQILILPIKGQGDALIKAQNIIVEIRSKLTHVNDSDGDHLKLVTPSYTYDIERTTFSLQNLFNGNKQLSDATHQFANENWRQLMDDLAPPAIKQIVRTCVKAINKFFAKVTVSQIILGYTPNPNS